MDIVANVLDTLSETLKSLAATIEEKLAETLENAPIPVPLPGLTDLLNAVIALVKCLVDLVTGIVDAVSAVVKQLSALLKAGNLQINTLLSVSAISIIIKAHCRAVNLNINF